MDSSDNKNGIKFTGNVFAVIAKVIFYIVETVCKVASVVATYIATSLIYGAPLFLLLWAIGLDISISGTISALAGGLITMLVVNLIQDDKEQNK